MRYVIIIPARYESSRFPGKPLVNLCGIPMIIRTYHQCVKAVPPELIYVATDDERIKNTCEQSGVQVILTSGECLTGTDRLAEAARQVNADIYINVQGDEPVFNPEDIRRLIAEALANPQDVINGYCEIQTEEIFRSSSTPKVVMRPDGRLLYMSRAAIPTGKSLDFTKAWRQVCAYAFPKSTLEAFNALVYKTPLEAIEDIEILRFLELGFDVRMILMSSESVAVDSPDDIMRAEQVIRSMGLD